MRILAALFLLALSLSCGNDEELLKIKRDVASLQEQIYELERNQEAARQDIRNALGKIERELDDSSDTAEIKEQLASIRESLSQYDARMGDLEGNLAELSRARATVSAAPAETSADPGMADEPENVSGEVVEQQFNAALLDFNRGKYEVAILGFQSILETFPGSPYSEASHYYLGRSYRESKDYRKAVTHFGAISEKYPQGNFLKQAMYYEGESYYYLNQPFKAILTLRDLIKRFPGTQEATLASKFLKKAGYEN